ncbi:MAG: hypothetical protein MJZ99_10510 [Bacteroidales bacterium]|nr:hypothetical protein [Bacteroidales bacterium]
MRKFLANSAQHFDTDVNRNVFDISKTHQASYNFGKIYPMYWREIQANETISIKEQHSFEMDVLNHPLANNIKLNTAFFYVRYKALYDDWEKFIRQPPTTKQSAYAVPFLSGRKDDFFGIGSLANHFGIPAVQYGVAVANTFVAINDPSNYPELSRVDNYMGNGAVFTKTFRYANGSALAGSNLFRLMDSGRFSVSSRRFQPFMQPLVQPISPTNRTLVFQLVHGIVDGVIITPGTFSVKFFTESGDYLYTNSASGSSFTQQSEFPINSPISSPLRNTTISTVKVTLTSACVDFINNYISQGNKVRVAIFEEGNNALFGSAPLFESFPLSFSALTPTTDEKYLFSMIGGFRDGFSYATETEVSTVVNSPFSGDRPRIPLPSWLFRAYIGCYNAHFRNRLLNPLLDDDGSILTDHCLPASMRRGGADTYPYEFQYCQYQPDIFNQCLVSPTGNMYDQPLVGITRNQDLADQPGSAILHYKQDGQSYDVEVSLDGLGNMTGITSYTADTNHMIIDTLKDAIAYGIPIVAMKNVEALSKWLTATYRGGLYSYNDFVAAHFGKPSHYRNQLTPEYLGGNTTYINSSSVVNTGQAPGQGQGELVGRGSFHGGDDKIVCHADDYGLVIGLCWFSVQTASAQHLDRHFLRFLPGDFATPEFANLGCEPIPYKMLAPLQTSVENQDKTFGYQRIYGDKLWAFDTIAGDYLDTYQGDIMVRRYDSLPQLTNDFVLMKPGELTNPFMTDMDLDHIRGFWQFDTNIVTWLNQTPNQIVM